MASLGSDAVTSKVYWSPVSRSEGNSSKLTMVGLVSESSVSGFTEPLRLVRVSDAAVVSASYQLR